MLPLDEIQTYLSQQNLQIGTDRCFQRLTVDGDTDNIHFEWDFGPVVWQFQNSFMWDTNCQELANNQEQTLATSSKSSKDSIGN